MPSVRNLGATGEVNPDRVLLSAVFVSSAGATLDEDAAPNTY
jgi:hypothetical protein